MILMFYSFVCDVTIDTRSNERAKEIQEIWFTFMSHIHANSPLERHKIVLINGIPFPFGLQLEFFNLQLTILYLIMAWNSQLAIRFGGFLG